jgi:diguanylate cyclase (GGDEF)-like protein
MFSEARFRHLATHDALTELPNRASVLQSLEIATEIARGTGTSVCIALIDLDHFKRINDSLGHLAGDEVLRQAARRLASAIRSTDVIGRYGGEEFLIVFKDMELEHGTARCEIVRRALCDLPIRWEDQDLTITCSIGVAAAGRIQSPVPVLVSSADDAMYAAKTLGRNRVVSASAPVPNEFTCLAAGH